MKRSISFYKFLSAFLSLAMIFAILSTGLFSIPAKAADEQTKGDYKFTVENGKATITQYTSFSSGKLDIPAYLAGYPVVAIGPSAFKSKNMTGVTIPSGVISIGREAFAYCKSLVDISIPKTVMQIGKDAFYYCKRYIYKIKYAKDENYNDIKSKPYGGEYWNDGAFIISGCLLEGATITRAYEYSDVRLIADYALSNNTYLKEVRGTIESIGDFALSSTVEYVGCSNPKYIGSNAFTNCSNLQYINVAGTEGNYVSDKGVLFDKNKTTLVRFPQKAILNLNYSVATSSYAVPTTVTNIADNAFRGNQVLKSVNLSNVQNIGNCAFYNCYGLETVSMSKVINIGSYAFYSCRLITRLSFPKSLETIGENAFCSCSGLTSITLPSEVKLIGSGAFRGCTGLANITISDNVTSIVSDSFENTSYYNNNSNWDNDVLYINNHLIRAKSTLSGEYIVRNGTVTIAASAFSDCRQSLKVVLPKSLAVIGNNAFLRTVISAVKYYGTDAEKKNISIGSGNETLTKLTWTHLHEISKKIITKPTCNQKGYTTHYCDCGYTYKDAYTDIDTNAHNYKPVVKKPSCTEQGYTTYTCEYCKDSYKGDITEIVDHNYIEKVTEPTCTEQGYTTYTCEYCKDSYKGDITEIVDHNYLEKVTEPTCTEQGYTTYTCEYCQDTYTGDYTPVKHSYTTTVVSPTENTLGYTDYVCKYCGDSFRGNYVTLKDIVSGVKTTPSDVDITLYWDAYEGATEYYAKVYDKDFTKCLKTITTKGTSAVFDYKLLSYNTDYKFIVTAKLSSGKYLTVANATRVDGAMVIGNRVVGHTLTMEGKGAVVSFLPVKNATEYLVNVFENDAQGERIYTATLTSDTTSARIMNNLTAGTKYVVMINAKVDGKYMSLADLRVNGIGVTFTAPVINPSSITVADETATSIRFNWDAVRGAEQYFIKVTEKESGKLVNTLKAEGKTTATLSRWTDGTRISPNTTYLLQFYTYVNSTTNSGEYGAPIEVTTKDFEPIKITARYNKNVNKVNLSWNKTTNAVGYFVSTYKDGVKITTKYLDGVNNTIYEFIAPKASGTYTYGVMVYEKNTSGTAYTPVSISNAIYL